MKKLSIIDDIIKEPQSGAHRNPEKTFGNVKKAIKSYLKELDEVAPEKRINDRIAKFSDMGVWK